MPHRTEEELRSEILRLQEQLSDYNANGETAESKGRRLNLLESMMETVPVGIVLSDETGKIIHGNSHVEKMLLHPVLYSNDVDSYGEWAAFHEDGRRVESSEYPLSRVIRDGDARAEVTVQYQRGDGSRFWLRIVGEPVHNSDGKIIGATAALIDIDEERGLKEAQEILIGELNHRVKNAFTVFKSIVSLSLRNVDVKAGLRETVDERLDAYAKAHSKLVGSTWDRAPLAVVAEDVLSPIGGSNIHISGPDIEIPSRQALAFSMAFYELATNAIKYGALSEPDGKIDLQWRIISGEENSMLEINWIERGGPSPKEPNAKGFGSIITGRALQMETSSTIDRNYPSEGFEWRLIMPVKTKENDE